MEIKPAQVKFQEHEFRNLQRRFFGSRLLPVVMQTTRTPPARPQPYQRLLRKSQTRSQAQSCMKFMAAMQGLSCLCVPKGDY